MWVLIFFLQWCGIGCEVRQLNFSRLRHSWPQQLVTAEPRHTAALEAYIRYTDGVDEKAHVREDADSLSVNNTSELDVRNFFAAASQIASR